MTVTQTTLHLPQTQPNQELHLNAAITPQQQRQPPWANNLMRRNQRNSTSDIRDHYRPPQITASTSRTPTLRNRRAAVGHQKTRSAAQDEVYRHCCENKTRLPQRTTTIAATVAAAQWSGGWWSLRRGNGGDSRREEQQRSVWDEDEK
ncbi:hypothetical protein DEO72_LG1g2999 [Vigna unguiculata]|uniref:Uncharacterized protein n=1 Tax=Vigna unguiculata TaxID=3917 RepID=A0A4D6KRN5_VIGUN|nr:hypothetical protein DEO72_LG1g2999 [Vigna unguiculata]